MYEPYVEKIERQELRAKRKAKREKYKILYKEELAKERAKLQAQKEIDIELYKTKRAIQKAHAKAISKVKPFTPRDGFKMPSKRLTPEQKRRLKKAGVDIGKTTVTLGKAGLSILDKMFSEKKRSPKRKYKKKAPTRKYKKKTTKRKTTKRKGKSYYCRKCKQRHSYSSKIGRRHRR